MAGNKNKIKRRWGIFKPISPKILRENTTKLKGFG
jgi:hypothetical protein